MEKPQTSAAGGREAFLRSWRQFADGMPSTTEQAQSLLPGFQIDRPLDFIDGYRKGIRRKCDEIAAGGTICLDWSGSVGSPIGFFEGTYRGMNDCLEAFNGFLGLRH